MLLVDNLDDDETDATHDASTHQDEHPCKTKQKTEQSCLLEDISTYYIYTHDKIRQVH